MNRLYLTFSKSKRGLLIADGVGFVHRKLSSFDFFLFLKLLFTPRLKIIIELSGIARYEIPVLILLALKSGVYVDCHIAVFSKPELGKIKSFLYSFLLSFFTIIAHNERIRDKYKGSVLCLTPVESGEIDLVKSQTKDFDVLFTSAGYEDVSHNDFNRLVSSNLKILLTGRPSQKFLNYPNVHYLGFLSREELLLKAGSSRCVVSFTNRDDCLLLAAREALVWGVPVCVTGNKANRDFFGLGVHYLEDLNSIMELRSLEVKVNPREYYNAYMKGIFEDLNRSLSNY
jgi:hypothetical protein